MPLVSPIPRPLARRVDRLSRRAHRFHRFAHHPLCPRYAGEVIRLGRRGRVCLGCSLVLAGTVLGVGAGFFSPSAPGPALVAAALLLVAAGPAAIRAPHPGERPGGTPKLLTRLVPTALGGAAAGQALSAPSPARIAAAALAAAALGVAIIRYRRRGPDRSACRACPDGPAGPRCPGFSPIARRERAFSRLAGRWIAGATRPPEASRPEPAGTAAGPRSA